MHYFPVNNNKVLTGRQPAQTSSLVPLVSVAGGEGLGPGYG